MSKRHQGIERMLANRQEGHEAEANSPQSSEVQPRDLERNFLNEPYIYDPNIDEMRLVVPTPLHGAPHLGTRLAITGREGKWIRTSIAQADGHAAEGNIIQNFAVGPLR